MCVIQSIRLPHCELGLHSKKICYHLGPLFPCGAALGFLATRSVLKLDSRAAVCDPWNVTTKSVWTLESHEEALGAGRGSFLDDWIFYGATAFEKRNKAVLTLFINT